MFKNNIFIKLLIIIIALVVLAIVLFIGIIFNWANNTEIEMVGKTHVDFVVSPGQIVDYMDFLTLNEKTKQLEQIDEDIRYKISDYMKQNNLKLKEGHHYFNRIDGTYDEYINKDFKFERIN